MRTSVSRITEIFYDHFGDPVQVYPKFSVDESLVRVGTAPSMRSGILLADQLKRKPDSTICFLRTHALGDILLLTPIFNWMLDEYPSCRIVLATASGFLDLFKYWDPIDSINWKSIHDCDVGYYLDGIVEQDHLGGPQSYKHRLNLYCDFLGIDVPKDPVFSLPYSDTERKWAEGIVEPLRTKGKPVIVMQVFGSTKVKKFSLDKTMGIASKLSKSCVVILVHNAKEDLGTDNGLIDMTGRTNIHELTALIDCADTVVTMDSGILWVAHCTQTPVIVLLGPSRESERMNYHRNYHVVNLSKMINCHPCFERATQCKGKVTCMSESGEDQIVAEIEKGLNGFMSLKGEGREG